jgi:hypothetical protein
VKKATIATVNPEIPPSPVGELVANLRHLIGESRRQTVAAVKVGLTLLYWRVGDRLRREVLGGERAAYQKQIVVTVSRQLVTDFGRGYSEKNLRRMVQVCLGISRRGDCRDTVTTIELVALQCASAFRPTLSTRVLRRDGPHRGLERPHPAGADRFHAL